MYFATEITAYYIIHTTKACIKFIEWILSFHFTPKNQLFLPISIFFDRHLTKGIIRRASAYPSTTCYGGASRQTFCFHDWRNTRGSKRFDVVDTIKQKATRERAFDDTEYYVWEELLEWARIKGRKHPIPGSELEAFHALLYKFNNCLTFFTRRMCLIRNDQLCVWTAYIWDAPTQSHGISTDESVFIRLN